MAEQKRENSNKNSNNQRIKNRETEGTVTMEQLRAIMKEMQDESDKKLEKMQVESDKKSEKQSLNMIGIIQAKDKEIKNLHEKIDRLQISINEQRAMLYKYKEDTDSKDQIIQEHGKNIERLTLENKLLVEENSKLKNRVAVLESLDSDTINVGCLSGFFNFFKPSSNVDVTKKAPENIQTPRLDDRSQAEDTSNSDEDISPKKAYYSEEDSGPHPTF